MEWCGFFYLRDGKVALEEVDFLDTWKAMEALVDEGLVKAIGVSNFDIPKIEYILKGCRIRPAANQVELHPGLLQTDLLEFCAKENIHITAYSPLGNNIYGKERIVDSPVVSITFIVISFFKKKRNNIYFSTRGNILSINEEKLLKF